MHMTSPEFSRIETSSPGRLSRGGGLRRVQRGQSGSLLTVVLGLLFLVGGVGCRTLPPAPTAQQVPSAQVAPVILVSMDGFRRDYLERYAPPVLNQLAREGATAQAMRPAFPSLTFVCHYTLATGWHPIDHGIVGNRVEGATGQEPLTMESADKIDWWTWRGEPFWVTAERQGRKAATMFWPASSAVIHGRRPSYWHAYSKSFPYADRVAQVLQWLDLPPAQRPAFMTLYFEGTDTAGHAAGPWSQAMAEAVAQIDSAMGQLVAGLKERGLLDTVNLIVTADHGMAEIPPGDRAVYLGDHFTAVDAEARGFTYYAIVTPQQGEPDSLLARLRQIPHVRAYRANEIPGTLHFRLGDARSILVLAEEGWVVKTGSRPAESAPDAAPARTRGAHGYDNSYASMKVPFIARGPAFRTGATIPEFESVDVYSLVAHLIDVEPAPNSGSLNTFTPILVPEKSRNRAPALR